MSSIWSAAREISLNFLLRRGNDRKQFSKGCEMSWNFEGAHFVCIGNQPTFWPEVGKEKGRKIRARGNKSLPLSCCCRRISGLNLRRMCKTRVAPADAYINKKRRRLREKPADVYWFLADWTLVKDPGNVFLAPMPTAKKRKNDWGIQKLLSCTHTQHHPCISFS